MKPRPFCRPVMGADGRAFTTAGSRAAESTVARLLTGGTCSVRIRDMHNVQPPYMDYWAA